MAEPHESTLAVIAECDSPSVQASDEILDAVKAFRTALHKSSGQAATYQGLVGIATMDEEHPAIKEKYTGFDSSCRSVQMKHDKVADILVAFTGAIRSLGIKQDELREGIAFAAEEDEDG